MAIIMDGRRAAKHIKDGIGRQIAAWKAEGKRSPGLGIIQVGEDPASTVYVKNKLRSAARVGIYTDYRRLPANQEALREAIRYFNSAADIDGYIVQLPLPSGFRTNELLEQMDPSKDADGFHPLNLGRLLVDDPHILPATPRGILFLLEYYNISTSGKQVTVAGRSRIVGRPLAALLASKQPYGNATVSLIHSRTPEPEKYIKEADIFITAVGQTGIWKADMLKPGAVVVDVGINRTAAGKLAGDMDPAGLEAKASAYTPVPGGVGPMTVAMLLQNTVDLYRRHYLKETS